MTGPREWLERSTSPGYTPAEQKEWDEGTERLLAALEALDRPTPGGLTELAQGLQGAWLSFGPSLVRLHLSALEESRPAARRSFDAWRIRTVASLIDWLERRIP